MEQLLRILTENVASLRLEMNGSANIVSSQGLSDQPFVEKPKIYDSFVRIYFKLNEFMFHCATMKDIIIILLLGTIIISKFY